MAYSWPEPQPPAARQETIRLIRCAQCQGPLHYTKARGQPRQEDHEQGCDAFIKAMRIMRYADELKRSACEPAGSRRSTRRRRKYLRENAKKLSVAACGPDPVAVILGLANFYQTECQTPGKRARVAETTEIAEMLMLACWRLALGQEPAPITLRPG